MQKEREKEAKKLGIDVKGARHPASRRCPPPAAARPCLSPRARLRRRLGDRPPAVRPADLPVPEDEAEPEAEQEGTEASGDSDEESTVAGTSAMASDEEEEEESESDYSSEESDSAEDGEEEEDDDEDEEVEEEEEEEEEDPVMKMLREKGGKLLELVADRGNAVEIVRTAPRHSSNAQPPQMHDACCRFSICASRVSADSRMMGGIVGVCVSGGAATQDRCRSRPGALLPPNTPNQLSAVVFWYEPVS